ncbi:hypothetical protein CH300_10250 [Rhodococcus sp. 15-1154-1]|nr:hypothetical protein [Rhodococcus sp. 15-1154-1]OZF06425.1 hypothetical protein CH300_10250 [Rhodococcus sp. 15-1154-1]
MEWTAPDEVVRSGRITVASTAHIGDTVTVWVDPDGLLVHSPRSGTDAAVIGILTAAFIWSLGAAATLGVVLAAASAVDHRHMKEWDEEWRRLMDSRDRPAR